MSTLTQNTIERMNSVRTIIGKDYVSKEELLNALKQIGVNGITGQFVSKLFTPEGQYCVNPELYVPGTSSSNRVATPRVAAMAKPALAPVQEKKVVNLTTARETTLDAGDQFDASKLIPKLDPNFVPYGQYRKVKKILDTGRFFPVYLTGPTGVGKSTMIKHICASTGRQFARVVITKDTTDEDLFGRKTLKDGNLVWEDGVMTLAAEMGFPIVLDEISAGDPRNLFGFYTILEGDRHFIKDANKFVEPRKGFNIILTDNTLGRGDETGRYVGTNILNEAMLDRCAIALEQGYPNEKVETEIMLKRFEANGIDVSDVKIQTFAANVAKWTGMIRTAQEAGAVDDAVSTRRVLVIADHFAIFGKEIDAIEDACTRFGPTTKSAFVDYYTKLVGGGSVDAIIPTEPQDADSDLF